MRAPPLLLYVLLTTAAVPLEAQQLDRPLSVFLDCHTHNCDFDHFRRELEFVNWVRQPQVADVHVLVTSQRTGAGGDQYSLVFFGRRAFAAWSDTLTYTSRGTDTDAEVREQLAGRLELGLARFAARTPVAPDLRLQFTPPANAMAVTPATPADDPWNFWTFRIGLDGSLTGEAQEFGTELRGSADATRTTRALKVNVGIFGRYQRDEFELDDGSRLVSTSHNYSADLLTVWSLGPHWSVGGTADAGRSSYSNLDLRLFGGPAVEFDIYPYDESTTRQITFLYRIEAVSFNYTELTVNGKLSEILPRHRLTIAASLRQPWGQLHGSIEGTQYLRNPKVHRIDTSARIELRVFRGLSVEFDGRFSRIKDQFFLPAAGLTEEEILLRRQQRETNFTYDLSAGFTIRFGSSFANVVNPRMSDNSRGF